jgi:predicted ATP-grasp superfamily ATP-dependent carboligase
VHSGEDQEVERESRAVLSALKYTGLAEVEWKRNATDGRLLFLEVNARCWGWHALAARVVGNLPAMLFHVAHDKPVVPMAPSYGARWVKHITDLPVVADMWRRGDLTLDEYFRSLRGNLMGCEWQANDPLPLFLQVLLIPYLARRRGY